MEIYYYPDNLDTPDSMEDVIKYLNKMQNKYLYFVDKRVGNEKYIHDIISKQLIIPNDCGLEQLILTFCKSDNSNTLHLKFNKHNNYFPKEFNKKNSCILFESKYFYSVIKNIDSDNDSDNDSDIDSNIYANVFRIPVDNELVLLMFDDNKCYVIDKNNIMSIKNNYLYNICEMYGEYSLIQINIELYDYDKWNIINNIYNRSHDITINDLFNNKDVLEYNCILLSVLLNSLKTFIWNKKNVSFVNEKYDEILKFSNNYLYSDVVIFEANMIDGIGMANDAYDGDVDFSDLYIYRNCDLNQPKYYTQYKDFLDKDVHNNNIEKLNVPIRNGIQENNSYFPVMIYNNALTHLFFSNLNSPLPLYYSIDPLINEGNIINQNLMIKIRNIIYCNIDELKKIYDVPHTYKNYMYEKSDNSNLYHTLKYSFVGYFSYF
jgi:hypothetical protein